MIHDFKRAWADFQPSEDVNVLSGDDLLLRPDISARHTVLFRSWDRFIGQDDFGVRDSRLHLSLLPQPFFGDLSMASVFVLTLNPGLHPGDYYAEFLVPEYKDAAVKTMRQQLNSRFPFIWLDPRFSWHAGFSYWHGRFASLIDAFMGDLRISRREALTFFARSIATLEMLPYHSISFSLPQRIMEQLRSVQLARSFVSDVLVPRAKAGEVLLIAARQGAAWSLPDNPNAIVYTGSETRAAHLTPQTRGGEAILRHLLKAWRNAT